jgi:hypothetical protein
VPGYQTPETGKIPEIWQKKAEILIYRYLAEKN